VKFFALRFRPLPCPPNTRTVGDGHEASTSIAARTESGLAFVGIVDDRCTASGLLHLQAARIGPKGCQAFADTLGRMPAACAQAAGRQRVAHVVQPGYREGRLVLPAGVAMEISLVAV